MSNEWFRLLAVALIVCFNTRFHLFDKQLDYLGGPLGWVKEYVFATILTSIIFFLLVAWWPSFHFTILSWNSFFNFYIPFSIFWGWLWNAIAFKMTDNEEEDNGVIYDTCLTILFLAFYTIAIICYIAYWIIWGIINILFWLF